VRIRIFSFAVALLLSSFVYATPKYSELFSDAFKASVDAGMKQSTSNGRTNLLTMAMRQGTDSEVFFVFPLLFPREIIDGAQKAHVCVAEISASLSNIGAYLASTSAEQKNFPQAHAGKIRSDTDHLIVCLDQYYANGQLRFPSA